MKKIVIVGISILSLLTFSACSNNDKVDSKSEEVSKKTADTLDVFKKEFDPNEEMLGYVYIHGNFTGKGKITVTDGYGEDIDSTNADSNGNFYLRVNGFANKQILYVKAGNLKEKVNILPLDADLLAKQKQRADEEQRSLAETRAKKEAEDKLAAEAKAEEDRIKKEAEDKRKAEEERLKKEAEDKRVAEEQAKEAIANLPTEYKSALNKAYAYSEKMAMSKMGLYDQLTSEYGEKFSAEAAQYAIDNVKADWNANALTKARNYQESMSMSPEAIREQLTSEYGEKFTSEEADYAIQNLN